MWECCLMIFLSLAFISDVTSASYCHDLIRHHDKVPKRYFSENGVIKHISLYWGSEPAYAASVLLAVILRHKLGYQKIRLVKGPHDLTELANTVPYKPSQNYDDAILAISMAWEPSHYKPKSNTMSAASNGLAGPRLFEFGASSVPVRQLLHVHLGNKYRQEKQCSSITRWNFYTDANALIRCGFTSDNQKKYLPVYGPTSNMNTFDKTMKNLVARTEVGLKLIIIKRTDFAQLLRTGNESFLFLDYDLWANHPNVRAVQPPSCKQTENFTCSEELDTAVAMRICDLPVLQEYAPRLYETAYNFFPKPEIIRELLEKNDIEEAACEFVSTHNIISWVPKYKPFYELLIFNCRDDPNYSSYIDLFNVMFEHINKFYGTIFYLKIRVYDDNCNDANYVRNNLEYYLSLSSRNRAIGAIVGSIKNQTNIGHNIDGIGLPVLFYDAPGLNADTTTSTWLTSGRVLHLALALHHFIRARHWTRVAILSEPTATAKTLVDDLRAVDDSIGFGNHNVQLDIKQSDAEDILKKLIEENAHVILVNTNYKDAATLLSAGLKLEMDSPKDYAWIVREWNPNQNRAGLERIKLFTFSFANSCGDDVANTEGLPGLRRNLAKEWGNCTLDKPNWPVLGTSLVDAMLTLVHGFNYSIHKNSQIQNDIHSKEAIRLFEESLATSPVQGVNQKLTYKGHSLEEALVFVNEWHGNRHNRLARWRVNATARSVVVEKQWQDPYSKGKTIPPDGSSRCLVHSSDLYLPTCYDPLWYSILIFVVLSIPTITLGYRILCRHFEERQKKFICELLTQRQQRVAALSAGYLVDRSGLTLFEELGAGRFGFVRRGVLRVPGKPPQHVAVKALCDHEDESEILREACTLASLKHDNIIRLIGVCIDKDPPIVLMEVAFFGDLLQYLRNRRYLVEGIESDSEKMKHVDSEATHVSAAALTRLAREAASALGYLSLRGIIHRDFRASNCLVDVNRSLKLADFGLARETIANGMDGVAEYACRRRGLFPVLWMAPESLIHGVFSAASDVWAFGVLVFELVTLGARPFGDMSPLRVMQYVAAGRKPQMPRDASPQTIGLARLCWQREPDQRPSAAAVVAYLAEWPCALRPALDYECNKPAADADSGYGESPMSELLPC